MQIIMKRKTTEEYANDLESRGHVDAKELKNTEANCMPRMLRILTWKQVHNNRPSLNTGRVGWYSELPSVITAFTIFYCNYGNYDTVLFLPDLSANVTVLTVITRPQL